MTGCNTCGGSVLRQPLLEKDLGCSVRTCGGSKLERSGDDTVLLEFHVVRSDQMDHEHLEFVGGEEPPRTGR